MGKLCEKGIFQNENGVVISLVLKDKWYFFEKETNIVEKLNHDQAVTSALFSLGNHYLEGECLAGGHIILGYDDSNKDHNYYPSFIGTPERLENGVRMLYEMSYHANQDEIKFTKYDDNTKKILEQFTVDAKTGNVVE